MKLVKEVTEGLPEGYSIKAYAKYTYDGWDMEYKVFTKVKLFNNGDEIDKIRDFVPKPKTNRVFIFFKKQPRETWEQRCERYIQVDIKNLTLHAHDLEKRKRVTEGLFDSLREAD
jgi:hypothetical protein